MMNKRVCAAAFVAAAAVTAMTGSAVRAQTQTPAAAQAPPPPTTTMMAGRDILAKSVDAIGGAAAITAISAVHGTGTIEISGANLTGTVEIFAARPAMSRVNASIAGIGDIQSGCNGTMAWSVDPISGPSLLTGKALQESIADAQFDAQLNGSAQVKEATTLGMTTFDGKSAYKIKVVTTFGTEAVEYYDASTFLHIGTDRTSQTPMGELPTTTVIGGYKKFGALLQPTQIAQSAMGTTQTFTITSYTYDAVPASAFEPPASVKALIK